MIVRTIVPVPMYQINEERIIQKLKVKLLIEFSILNQPIRTKATPYPREIK